MLKEAHPPLPGIEAHQERSAAATALPHSTRAPVRPSLWKGSTLLFISATVVNGGNYLFNLLLGRWLGPAAFADLSLIVTLFLVVSFLTAGLQTPTARFGAIYVADDDLQGLAGFHRWARRWAGWVGVVLMAVFVLGAGHFQAFFTTASSWIFIIFGLFLPFYILQGVDRGLLQGCTRFGRLALTYQVEMWSRLLLGIRLVLLGLGVQGAVLGLGLSCLATWLVARASVGRLPEAPPIPAPVRREALLFVAPVLVTQLGQILINNSDILIVRRFFTAEEAGAYAALALIGRMVFFATWSIVTAMFPIAAQRHHRGESHRPLFYLSMAVVLLVSGAIIGATYFFAREIVQVLFGATYLTLAPLLWLYGVATLFYALANVVINYRLSIGNTLGTYLAIGGGVAQVSCLWLWHESLAQVVWIQIGLMAGLLVLLLAWDGFLSLREWMGPPLPSARGSR